ncbi:hypothetical protein TNCT_644251, partial [Trichonephila clavata]
MRHQSSANEDDGLMPDVPGMDDSERK